MENTIKEVTKRIFDLRWILNEARSDGRMGLDDFKEEMDQLQKDTIRLLDIYKDIDQDMIDPCLDVLFEIKRSDNLTKN